MYEPIAFELKGMKGDRWSHVIGRPSASVCWRRHGGQLEVCRVPIVTDPQPGQQIQTMQREVDQIVSRESLAAEQCEDQADPSKRASA